jgi:hypothetical protein
MVDMEESGAGVRGQKGKWKASGPEVMKKTWERMVHGKSERIQTLKSSECRSGCKTWALSLS